MKSVSQKMGIKENSRVMLLNAPKEAIEEMKLPAVNKDHALTGLFDYICIFVIHKKELELKFPNLKSHLKLSGMLWVSWPKGGQSDTDLSLSEVIKIGYEFGLVESSCISINSTWSALKFTHPKKGKIYNNSHAELKSRSTNR